MPAYLPIRGFMLFFLQMRAIWFCFLAAFLTAAAKHFFAFIMCNAVAFDFSFILIKEATAKRLFILILCNAVTTGAPIDKSTKVFYYHVYIHNLGPIQKYIHKYQQAVWLIFIVTSNETRVHFQNEFANFLYYDKWGHMLEKRTRTILVLLCFILFIIIYFFLSLSLSPSIHPYIYPLIHLYIYLCIHHCICLHLYL